MNEYDLNGTRKGDHPLLTCSEWGCNEIVREQIDEDYCPRCHAKHELEDVLWDIMGTKL